MTRERVLYLAAGLAVIALYAAVMLALYDHRDHSGNDFVPESGGSSTGALTSSLRAPFLAGATHNG